MDVGEDSGMQYLEKTSYRIVLLLIVGLTALSSAMNELNRVHELTLETNQLVAAWTGNGPVREGPVVVEVPEIPEVIEVPELPELPEMPVVAEKRVIKIVHFQKRDGKQCPISSSLQ